MTAATLEPAIDRSAWTLRVCGLLMGIDAEVPATASLERVQRRRALRHEWVARSALVCLTPELVQTAAQHPASAWMFAPMSALTGLVQRAGMLMLSRRMRHAVARAEVQALRDALGEASLRWVRYEVAAVHPGLEDVRSWLPDSSVCSAEAVRQAVEVLGRAVVSRSWSDAPLSLREAASRKLPTSTDSRGRQAELPLSVAEACTVCQRLISQMEPPWPSSFPVIR